MAFEGGIFIDILTRLNMASVDRVLKDVKTLMKEAGTTSGDAFTTSFDSTVAAGARNAFDPLVAASDAAFRQMQIGMADMQAAEARINDLRARNYNSTTDEMIAAQRRLDGAIANSQRLMAEASRTNAAYRDSFVAAPALGERGAPEERTPSTGNNRSVATRGEGAAASDSGRMADFATGAVIGGSADAIGEKIGAAESKNEGAVQAQDLSREVVSHRIADHLAEGGRHILKLGGLGAGLGLVGMTTYGVRTGAKVEENLAPLAALQGESPRNVAAITQAAWNQSLETGLNPAEISKLYPQIEQATNPLTGGRYRGQEAVDVVNTALKLGKVAHIDPNEAAQGLTTGMFNYRVGPQGASGMANLLAQGLAGFKGSAADYFEAQHTVDPIAAQAGIGAPEALAAIDAMSQTGQSAQQSATSFRSLLKSIAAPNSMVSSALQQIGLNPQDLSVNLSKVGLGGTLSQITNAIAAQQGPNGAVVLNAMANKPLMEQQQAQIADLLSPKAREYIESPDFQQSLVSGFKARSILQKAGNDGLSNSDMPLIEQWLAQQKKIMGASDVLKRNQPLQESLLAAYTQAFGTKDAAQSALMMAGSPEALTAYQKQTGDLSNAQNNPNAFEESFKKAMEPDIEKWHQLGQSVGKLSEEIAHALLPTIGTIVDKFKDMLQFLDQHHTAEQALIDAMLGLAAFWVAQKTKLTKLFTGAFKLGKMGFDKLTGRGGSGESAAGEAAAGAGEEQLQQAAETLETGATTFQTATDVFETAVTTFGEAAPIFGEAAPIFGEAVPVFSEAATAFAAGATPFETGATQLETAATTMETTASTMETAATQLEAAATQLDGAATALDGAAAAGGGGGLVPVGTPGGEGEPAAEKPGFMGRVKGFIGDLGKILPLTGPGMSADVKIMGTDGKLYDSAGEMPRGVKPDNGPPLRPSGPPGPPPPGAGTVPPRPTPGKSRGGIVGYAGGTADAGSQPLIDQPDTGGDSLLGLLPGGQAVGLRGGEGILTPEAVAALGGKDAIDSLNDNPFANPFKAATTLYGSFAKGVQKYSPFGKYLTATSQSLDSLEKQREDADKMQRAQTKNTANFMIDYLQSMSGGTFIGKRGRRGSGSYGGSGSVKGGSPEVMHAIAMAAADMGLDQDQYNDVKWIMSHESGFDPTVSNGGGHGAPSNNKAYGLGQFLGHMSDKYGQMGAYSGDPYQEATAAIQYMKDRYGSPAGAKAYWQTHGNYAHGGIVGYAGGGLLPLDVPKPGPTPGGPQVIANPNPPQNLHVVPPQGPPKAPPHGTNNLPGMPGFGPKKTRSDKGGHHRSSVHGDVPSATLIPGGTAPSGDRNAKENPSQQLTAEGKGFGVGGGIMGMAESAATMAANAFAPGSGQAAQMGFQLLNRAIGYGGQLLGIGLEGLMETFLPNDSPAADPSKNIFGKIALGIAGAHPSGKNLAGSHAKQLDTKKDLDQGAMAGKQQPGIHVENIHNHSGDHQETFNAINKAVNFANHSGYFAGQ